MRIEFLKFCLQNSGVLGKLLQTFSNFFAEKLKKLPHFLEEYSQDVMEFFIKLGCG